MEQYSFEIEFIDFKQILCCIDQIGCVIKFELSFYQNSSYYFHIKGVKYIYNYLSTRLAYWYHK